MKNMLEVTYTVEISTPAGSVWAGIASNGSLLSLEFDHLPRGLQKKQDAPTKEAINTANSLEKQLDEYFRGVRRSFDLPLVVEGTGFQRRVWAAIEEIPYGEVATYSHLAAMAGSPRACRAAGSATGSNPLAIVIPCHRVLPIPLYKAAVEGTKPLPGVGSYGGGEERKRALLKLEGLPL